MYFEIFDKPSVNKMPTVCLNMIVKNESKVIAGTLDNLCKYINFDYWVISDTGSTDNTQQIITDYFLDKGIPGELVSHEWKDFGHNRSKALEAAYDKTDFLLIFDADDKINGDFKLPLTKGGKHSDRYMLKFGQGFEYVRPLFINNRKKWLFKGVLHEFLHNVDPVNEDALIQGNYYIDSGRTGNRSQNPLKYYEDAMILEAAYEKELPLPDKGLSGRYAFYCGRSFKDAGSKYFTQSIEWYKKVLEIPNHWHQEKYYSALEIGIMYREKKQMDEAVKYFLKTLEYDGERIEGLIMAVEYFYQSGQFILINALYHKFKNYKHEVGDKLFINRYLYQDRLEFFNAITAYTNAVNDRTDGYHCCKQLLIRQIIGQNDLNLAINNLFCYRELLEQDKDTMQLFNAVNNMVYKFNELIHNPNTIELWNILFKQNRPILTIFNKTVAKNLRKLVSEYKNGDVNILITFTTCKRFDLFKETLNSILNCWTDVEKINNWFCVDDNSSADERQQMKSTYNWIEYHMKTPEEKGHRQSMNIIWNKLNKTKPDYWIHMEDDFLFYHSMNYVSDAIAALKQGASQNIKQIVFNRNYAETVDNYHTRGHLPSKMPTNMPNIVLHDHKPNETIVHYQNSHYWPHYSFRPAMTDVKAILKLGNYDSPNQFFERDYADKWTDADYKTAFFDRITHRHIGRLTTEISSGTVKNAYELNKESQFNVYTKPNKKVKMINLERRTDRKDKIVELFKKGGVKDYDIVKAVDGLKLEPLLELKNLFKGNDFGNRRGVIGCALSHLKLWRELIEDKQNSYYVVFEDDFELCEGFGERFKKLMPAFAEKELIFLGYHMFAARRKEVKDIYDTLGVGVGVPPPHDGTDLTTPTPALTTPTVVGGLNPRVEPLNKDLYIGGTFSYSVNKEGAKKLVAYIEQNGIKHGIDYVMKIVPDLHISELQPLLVFSDWSEMGGPPVDSDIQTSSESLDFNNVIEEQFEFMPKLDQIGHDLYYHRGMSLTDSMLTALKDNNCIGFNTLGFFKNKVEQLTSSQYFGEKDGMYIKKSYQQAKAAEQAKAQEAQEAQESAQESAQEAQLVEQEKKYIKIKMLCNWCSGEQLCKEWSNMCMIYYSWKNIEMIWQETDTVKADYYVIINSPLKNEYYDPKRTLVFQMEPWIQDPAKTWGVKTWGEWATPDPAKFFKVFSHKTHLNNVQWQLKMGDGFERAEPFRVATICSSKNHDEGHILRNNFIKYVGEHTVGEHTAGEHTVGVIDVYGRQNYHNFRSYRGPVKDDNKYNVYARYKYCFAAENNSEHNYATEKIWECILCESLCFYWGCPNLEEYLDPQSFVRLPLEDPAEALKIMQQALEEDWWSQRIETIKLMKEKILTKLGFFPLLQSILA